MHLKPNSFSSIQFDTPEDELHASIFFENQRAYLQNQIAMDAEQLLGLIYDEHNPMRFVQQQASLKGRIDLIQYLLDNSDASEQVVNTIPTNQDED